MFQMPTMCRCETGNKIIIFLFFLFVKIVKKLFNFYATLLRESLAGYGEGWQAGHG